MGDLEERAPLEQQNKINYLVSEQQVCSIGDHYVLLLAEIKHRGAFEQAYVGFTMLCLR